MSIIVNWSEKRLFNEKEIASMKDNLIGVYLLSYSTEYVGYVGKSEDADLKSRLLAHLKSEKNERLIKLYREHPNSCYVRFAVLEKIDISDIEYSLYMKYHPSCNINEPEGKRIEFEEKWS